MARLVSCWRRRHKRNTTAVSATCSGEKVRHGSAEAGDIVMNEERLTAKLAEDVLGWKAGPDRFIKSGRRWIPKWRFAPFIRLDDAFELLNRLGSQCRLERAANGIFTVQVRLCGRIGEAFGPEPARAVTYAIARMLEIVDETELTVGSARLPTIPMESQK